MAFWITLAGAAAPTAVAVLYLNGYHYELALGIMTGMIAAGVLAYLLADRRAGREHNAGEIVDIEGNASSSP